MQAEHSAAALADDGGRTAEQVAYDIPRPGTDRHRAVRRALTDALALARLQADVLTRLEEADQAGDDEAVVLCHVELDHVMAAMAETEQVRTGERDALTGENDLTCGGCGAAAEPVYARPRLLGYRCAECGLEGEDPAVRDERKRAGAFEAARTAVEQAADRIEDALATFGHRGKKAREEGIAALRGVETDLTALGQRLRKAP